MKSIKLLATGAFVFALLTPVFVFGEAYAQPAPLLVCRFDFDGNIQYNTEGCDLAVDKQVSINDGPYQIADTEATAAQANVGDKVTWKITVSNPNAEESFAQPYGSVRVTDVLPTAGVAYDGSSYTASTGSYSGNVWEFVLYEEGDPGHTNLDATLTIVTQSTATGLYKNTATLTDYNSCITENSCFWYGGYQDFNADNNSNDAWIDPSASMVLGDSTPVVLAATGTGVAESVAAAGLLTSTLGLLGYSRFSRRNS